MAKSAIEIASDIVIKMIDSGLIEKVIIKEDIKLQNKQNIAQVRSALTAMLKDVDTLKIIAPGIIGNKKPNWEQEQEIIKRARKIQKEKLPPNK